MRLPSGDWYAQQVDKEQRWLPVLAPQLVYRWLDGELASKAPIGDLVGFATTLAGFLKALGRVDATGGPGPGHHNFFRAARWPPTVTGRWRRRRRRARTDPL